MSHAGRDLPPPIDARPQRKRVAAVRIAALVLLCLLSLVGIAFIALLVWAWRGVEKQDEAELQGAAFGASATDEACLGETVRRVRASDTWIRLAEGEFLRSCLQVATPSPQFCADAPMPFDRDRGHEWRLERCKSAGLELDDANCSAIFWRVQNYCVDQKASG